MQTGKSSRGMQGAVSLSRVVDVLTLGGLAMAGWLYFMGPPARQEQRGSPTFTDSVVEPIKYVSATGKGQFVLPRPDVQH